MLSGSYVSCQYDATSPDLPLESGLRMAPFAVAVNFSDRLVGKI